MTQAFALSDIGRKRQRQEDRYLIDPERRLYVVADGLGGHTCGAQASRLAVETIDRYVTPERLRAAAGHPNAVEDVLYLALDEAHSRIQREARQQKRCWDMGTTVLVARLDGRTVHVFGVGDGSAYRLGRAGPERLVLAHRASVRSADGWWMRPEEYRAEMRSGHLTHCVGQRGALEPRYRRCDREDGDRLLLCTDGLTDHVSGAEIHAVARQPKDAEAICRELVQLAKERGGEDNITVILVAGPDLPDVP